MKDEALKLALEALEMFCEHGAILRPIETRDAIKEALAQPEPWEKFCDSNCVWTDHHPDCKLAEQEPVAWTLLLVGEHHGIIGKAGDAFASAPEHYRRVDVYTTPPQRTWVGLTLDERIELAQDVDWAAGAYCEYAEKIEAKLKELNT